MVIESLTTIEISVILFVSQILFLSARSLNVMYTANEDVWRAVGSGLIVSVFWLTSISLGVSALLNNDMIPVISWLIGGGCGTYLSFPLKKYLSNLGKK